MFYDVCIAGGGASGLTAAIAAARQGASVLILEHLDKTGKKILATGNGKCNLTNLSIRKNAIDKDAFRGSHPDFAFSVLNRFDAEDTIRFFESLSLYTMDRDGYVYPMSEQALTVSDALKWECASLKIDIVCGEHLKRISKKKAYLLQTDKNTYQADKVILAMGGSSQKKLGSDGSGFDLVSSLGYQVQPQIPALCALYCKEAFFKELAGIRIRSKICLHAGNQTYHSEGELQLTAYGLSGIPIFQISRYAGFALLKKQKVTASIDLLPASSALQLERILQSQIENHPKWTIKMILSGLLNKKLVPVILKLSGISQEAAAGTLSKKQKADLIRQIKAFDVTITKTADFEASQVTAGGVDTNQIDPVSMESKRHKGLYMVGEMLDIDGTCGGYNLQWAWATGFIAGTHAGRNKYVKGKSN